MTTIYGIGSLLGQLPSFILIPVYTAYLFPKDYGVIALLALTVRLLTRVASSPINQGLNRYYYKPNFEKQREELITSLLAILIIKTVILILLYWTLSNWLCIYLLGEPSLVPIVKLYGLSILLVPFEDFITTFLRLRKMALYFVVLNLLKTIVYSAISVILLVIFDLGIMSIVWGGLVGSFSFIILAWSTLQRHLVWKFKFKVASDPLKYGYPLIITGYAGLLLQSGDRYILNMFGNLSDVGIYSLGYQCSNILNNAYVMPVQNATAPKAFQLECNPEKQRQYLRSSATLYYAFGLFLVLTGSLFAEEIIKLLVQNAAFWDAWKIVPIITLSYLHEGLGNFFVWGMRMDHQTFNISKIAVISCLLNILLNIFLIPHWGIIGAAISTYVSYLISNFIQHYKSSKAYSLYFDLKRILLLFTLALAIFGIASSLASTDSLFLNISIKLGFVLLYPSLLYIKPNLVFETSEQYKNMCNLLLNYNFTKTIGNLLHKRRLCV
jgi:O-antigen/teichoic acid export membrane protein